MIELAPIIDVYDEDAEAEILGKTLRVKDIKSNPGNRVLCKEVKPGKTNRHFSSLFSVSLFETYVPDLNRVIVFYPQKYNSTFILDLPTYVKLLRPIIIS